VVRGDPRRAERSRPRLRAEPVHLPRRPPGRRQPDRPDGDDHRPVDPAAVPLRLHLRRRSATAQGHRAEGDRHRADRADAQGPDRHGDLRRRSARRGQLSGDDSHGQGHACCGRQSRPRGIDRHRRRAGDHPRLDLRGGAGGAQRRLLRPRPGQVGLRLPPSAARVRRRRGRRPRQGVWCDRRVAGRGSGDQPLDVVHRRRGEEHGRPAAPHCADPWTGASSSSGRSRP
jgi:hypothetical protein